MSELRVSTNSEPDRSTRAIAGPVRRLEPSKLLTLALKLSAGSKALLLAGANAGHAQEAWRFQITPYVWGPSLQGDVTPDPRLPALEFGESLGNILNDLNAAFFFNGTARQGRLVLFADLTYSDVSEGHTWTLRPTIISPEIDIAVDVDVKMTTATLAAGYSVVDDPEFVLDLMAGARIWSADITLDVPNAIPGLPDAFSESGTHVDPIVALRARYQLAPDWSLIGYLDYGGGLSADTTWQAFGAVNYQIDDRWFVSAGYRALAFDYDDGEFAFDFGLAGPVVGVTYRF